MHFFLDLFMFHRHYSNWRPQNSGWYNRIICQTVENTSFLERLSCILHACAKGSYQGYKSNFGFRLPFSCEILPISLQKSVFGFAERNTPAYLAMSSNYGLGCPDLEEKKIQRLNFKKLKSFKIVRFL